MPEEKEAKPSTKTSHYVLKKGVRHAFILNGEHATTVGDGVGTIELNTDQAAAFKDKILSEAKGPVEFEAPAPIYDEVADSGEVVDDSKTPPPAKK